jgi:hypothetical protein
MTLQHYMRTVMLSSHLALIVELSVDNQPGWHARGCYCLDALRVLTGVIESDT